MRSLVSLIDRGDVPGLYDEMNRNYIKADDPLPSMPSTTTFHLAATAHNTIVLRMLLLDDELNPNVSVREGGDTPLHEACMKNLPKSVSLLAASPRVDLGCINQQGRDPFAMCLWTKSEKSALALIQASRWSPARALDQLLSLSRAHGMVLTLLAALRKRGSVRVTSIHRSMAATTDIAAFLDDWARSDASSRLVDICVGLAGLDLPVLQTLTIYEWDMVLAGTWNLTKTYHDQWEVAKWIKHARTRDVSAEERANTTE